MDLCRNADIYRYVVDEMIRHTTIEIEIPEGSAMLSIQFYSAGDRFEVVGAFDIEDGEDRWEELPVDIQDYIIQRCLTAGPKRQREVTHGY